MKHHTQHSAFCFGSCFEHAWFSEKEPNKLRPGVVASVLPVESRKYSKFKMIFLIKEFWENFWFLFYSWIIGCTAEWTKGSVQCAVCIASYLLPHQDKEGGGVWGKQENRNREERREYPVSYVVYKALSPPGGCRPWYTVFWARVSVAKIII